MLNNHRPNKDEPSAPFVGQSSFFPRKGDMVLFPSWLVHRVESQGGTDQRIAWSFNLAGGVEAWGRTVY